MKVFLSGDPSLREKLQSGARQADLDNRNVNILITGPELILYPTDHDVSAISFSKEELETLLARMG